MVNTWEVDERWAAPGGLEQVRRFLNTWELRTADRGAVDRLPDLVAAPRGWSDLLATTPVPDQAAVAQLQALRKALRQVVEQPGTTVEELETWLDEHPVVARLAADDDEAPAIRLETAAQTVCGHLLAIVATAILDGTWRRLRVCPDCRLVFFDRSRNRSKRWCGMYAGTTGRACGSIAKVRRWRERQSP